MKQSSLSELYVVEILDLSQNKNVTYKLFEQIKDW